MSKEIQELKMDELDKVNGGLRLLESGGGDIEALTLTIMTSATKNNEDILRANMGGMPNPVRHHSKTR